MVYQHVSPLKGAFGEYTICEFYPTSANNVCFGCIVSLASVDQFTRASASLLCWWGHTPCHWTWVWDSFCVQVLFYPNTSITNLQKLICFSFSGGGSSMFKPPEPAEALVFSLRNDKITGDLRALARFPCLLLEGERVCRACGWRVRIPDVAIQAFFGARNGKIDENRLTSRPMAGESISHHFWISGQHVCDISIHKK